MKALGTVRFLRIVCFFVVIATPLLLTLVFTFLVIRDISESASKPNIPWSATYCPLNGCQVIMVKLSGLTKNGTCPTELDVRTWTGKPAANDQYYESLKLQPNSCTIDDSR